MSERTRKYLRLAALWAFPLALWLVATGWYGFDLGKYSDDWAISLRTPETDGYAWPASPFLRWGYFWRPLHLVAVYGLATVFWHHDWVNHAISALAHLGVGVLLYRLLTGCGVGRASAMCGLCVFLVLPVSIEAVLWPAALGSVVGVGWFVILASMCVRRARAAEDLAGPAQWTWLCLLGVMGLTTACWHEQPAAGVLALPAIFLAVSSGSIRRTLRRAAAATVASGVGVGVYVVLFVWTVPAGRRGGANTIVAADSIANRLVRLCEMAWNLSMGARGRDTTLDGLTLGWGEMGHTLPGVVACVVGALGGIAFVLAVFRSVGLHDAPKAGAGAEVPVQGGWLVLFGVGMAIASLAPIALVSWQPMHPRYLYGADAGVAIAMAAVLDLCWTRTERLMWRRAFRVSTVGLIVLGSMLGALSCVGWQAQFRARWRADVDQMEQLVRLVPAPAAGTVFVPVEISDGRMFTRRSSNPGVHGAMAQPWSCWAYVQRGYARSDVSATHARSGQRLPIKAFAEGIRYPRGVCDAYGRADAGTKVVPWERVVAFAVDDCGVVRLVTREEVFRRVGGGQGASE